MDPTVAAQTLLAKWHDLPADQQQAVLDFVEMLHQQQSAKTKPQPIAQAAPHRAALIPESERQRIIARVKAAWEERPQMLERMKVRQEQGWEAARKAAEVLKKEFGVTRVVLFGSLLDHTQMHDRSDIDLAIWGLPDNQLFHAMAAVNYVFSPYDFPPVDLVPIEKAYPYVYQAIEAEGVEL
jgi:predicted nucleotidyltransferase